MESMSMYANMEDLLKAKCERLERELADAKGNVQEWTTEAPTVDGWYWKRIILDSGKIEDEIVEINNGTVSYISDDAFDDLEDIDGYEWKGPIDPNA